MTLLPSRRLMWLPLMTSCRRSSSQIPHHFLARPEQLPPAGPLVLASFLSAHLACHQRTIAPGRTWAWPGHQKRSGACERPSSGLRVSRTLPVITIWVAWEWSAKSFAPVLDQPQPLCSKS